MSPSDIFEEKMGDLIWNIVEEYIEANPISLNMMINNKQIKGDKK